MRSAFTTSPEDQYETADFPLSELNLPPTTLAALAAAGYETFLQVIDLERRDFLGIPGLGEEDADRLLQLIDELTVVEGDGQPDEEEPRAEGGEDAGAPKSEKSRGRGAAVASTPKDSEREQRSE